MAVVSLSAVPSFACDPDPNFPYDDIGSADISIIVATVSNVEMVTNETSCWVLSYDVAEYLYGSGSSEFFVTTCIDEIDQFDAMLHEAEGLTYLGFVPAAEVLLGVVRETENYESLRYAVPTCWGPLHYNLHAATEEERAELMETISVKMH